MTYCMEEVPPERKVTAMSAERKTDRRTLYTRQVIKDALLELLEKSPYVKINVTALCKQAEITRATFYLHYGDLNDVLDEVIREALDIAEHSVESGEYAIRRAMLMCTLKNGPDALKGNEQFLAPCQRIADHPKYRALFMDDSLSYYIIRKIYLAERTGSVPGIARQCRISEEDADRLFMFMIYGLYYVNRSMKWEKSDDWYRMQYIVNHVLENGLDSVSALPGDYKQKREG